MEKVQVQDLLQVITAIRQGKEIEVILYYSRLLLLSLFVCVWGAIEVKRYEGCNSEEAFTI